jgi:carbon-monoxide dehydrogenase small subunit
MRLPIALQVNGQSYEAEIDPAITLLDLLRDVFGLTGTKTNCLEAECGVCSVLIDGMSVNSCTMLAAQCRGKSVLTVEGLARDGELHPLQQADNPHPDEAQIRGALAGTLCRCTGYQKIVDAVAAVARGDFAIAAAKP